ncbi:MAG: four-carbon acid sugar kinase family protein [Fretibacterium sp.]|nr:four-carbon acid sugar kinase family protein [Fretibacterium sp.]
MNGKSFFLGVAADDFTGASDAASFLAEAGLSVVLCNEIPDELANLERRPDAVVVALKTRTIPAQDAVQQTLDAFSWLKSQGARQFYFKYCATFDSTEKGNIGPVVDAVLERYGLDYTVLCPALPVNGRTVRDGILYVNGVPLAESPMKDHPLTPMRDSDVTRLMEKQSECRAFILTAAEMTAVRDNGRKLEKPGNSGSGRWCYVPDYYEEEHGDLIAAVFGELPFLTGGSGLAGAVGRRYAHMRGMGGHGIPSRISASPQGGKALLLAGSCSKITLEQISEYQKAHDGLRLVPEKLINGEQTAETVMEWIRGHGDSPLVFSSQPPEEMRQSQSLGRERVAEAIESTLSAIAANAVGEGYTRIISAGGETSGAVTKALGYQAFYIGRSVAPGVPVMMPVENPRLRLVLKSGGFGQVDFFERAVEMTKA